MLKGVRLLSRINCVGVATPSKTKLSLLNFRWSARYYSNDVSEGKNHQVQFEDLKNYQFHLQKL